MLNGRLYRAAIAPFLLALLIAAFSLTSSPPGLSSTLAPDAFQGARALRDLHALAAGYPDRRPGSAGDAALAQHIASTLEGLGGTAGGGFSVRRESVEGGTIDGQRTLETVVAQRPGSTEASPIVIVAHRDAAARGSQAELSGTAVLLELARVFSQRETKRTIVLVSTSGGSGGDAGAAAFATHAQGPIDAAIVLGDLASARERRPVVIPYSDGYGSAPAQLQHTLSDAIAREAGAPAGGPSALAALAHLAFPLTVGEQGVLEDHGIPAALVQVSGERGPAPGASIGGERIEGFGRAVLSAIDALDTARNEPAKAQTGMPLQNKTLPAWAVRLLGATLLLGPLLLAVDGLARMRRRRLPVARWTLWTISCGLPFLACAVFARLLGLAGIIVAPAVPVPARALPFDAGAASAVVAVALVFALAWLAWGSLVRHLRWGTRPDTDIAGVAMLLVAVAVAALAWLLNPYAALLLLPALHLWLLIASPELRPRRSLSFALLAIGLLPLGLLIAFYARQLGLGPGAGAWSIVLLLAGGHVGLAAALLWSLGLGCSAACALLIANTPAELQHPGGPAEITIRGPLSYAGPGSLGGTESALRR